MALVTCTRCGAQISDKAGTCPRCGAALRATPNEDSEKQARQRVGHFLAANKKYLPENEIPRLRADLSALSKEEMLEVECVSFKDPVLLILLSVFTGAYGVDRFVLGDTVKGMMKIAISVLACIFLVMGAFGLIASLIGGMSYDDYDRPAARGGILSAMILWVPCLLLSFLAFVWYIVDIFLMNSLTKKYNVRKIYKIIRTAY